MTLPLKVEIEHDVPIPPKRHTKYQFPIMKVGDSRHVLADGPWDGAKCRELALAAARGYAKTHNPTWEFVSSIDADNKGARVWRIK